MYSIRFPFLLPNRWHPSEIDNHDEPYVFDTQDKHKLIFTLQAIDKDFSFSGKRYVLTIDGFSTEEKAKEYVQKVQFGMLWTLLQKDIAFEVGFNKNMTFFLKNLKELFGKDLKENKEPSIYCSDSRPEFISGGAGRVKLGTSFHQYMQFLIEGMTKPNINHVLNNDKLKLALELYNQHLFETSKKAQFLSLVTILEVLSLPSDEKTKRGRKKK